MPSQYVLYEAYDHQDNFWVSNLRVPQELLDQLLALDPQHKQITFQLVASTANSRKSALLSIVDLNSQEIEEQYELLCFDEDPGVNHVLAFRPDPDLTQQTTPPSTAAPMLTQAPARDPSNELQAPIGCSLYKVGHVHQKLLVQRQLTSSEKDRMKDRHSSAVLESKARASKLIDKPVKSKATGGPASGLLGTRKRPRLSDGWSSASSFFSSAKSSTATTAQESSDVQLPPSALTAERAMVIQKRIERPAPKPHVLEPPAAPVVAESEPPTPEVALPTAKKRSKKAPTTDRAQPEQQQTDGKRQDEVPTKTKASKGIKKIKEEEPCKVEEDPKSPVLPAQPDSSQSPSPSRITCRSPKQSSSQSPTLVPVKADAKRPKRPRARASATGGTRTTGLSFLPAKAQETLERVMNARPLRTSILDDRDCENFEMQLQSTKEDWALLDRASSIAVLRFHQQQNQSQRRGFGQPEAATALEPGLAIISQWMDTLERQIDTIEACLIRYKHKTK